MRGAACRFLRRAVDGKHVDVHFLERRAVAQNLARHDPPQHLAIAEQKACFLFAHADCGKCIGTFSDYNIMNYDAQVKSAPTNMRIDHFTGRWGYRVEAEEKSVRGPSHSNETEARCRADSALHDDESYAVYSSSPADSSRRISRMVCMDRSTEAISSAQRLSSLRIRASSAMVFLYLI